MGELPSLPSLLSLAVDALAPPLSLLLARRPGPLLRQRRRRGLTLAGIHLTGALVPSLPAAPMRLMEKINGPN